MRQKKFKISYLGLIYHTHVFSRGVNEKAKVISEKSIFFWI